MKIKNLIIAFLLVFAYGCSKNEDNEDNGTTKTIQKTSAVKDYTKEFELSLNDGTQIQMKKRDDGFDIKNNDKAILFAFFTTWCPPCKAEIPNLVSLQNKFHDEIKIVGVLMEDKTNTQINDFIKQYNINYDIASGDSNYYFAKALGGVVGIPFIVIYYPNGKYATHYIGIVPEEMLESDIKKVVS